jgi:hypothetical protein
MDGAGGLQSGFVLAAILAAVLFAGGAAPSTADLLRRLFQVALAAVIAFTAISATQAFVRAPDPPANTFQDSFDGSDDEDETYEFLEDVADRNQVATTIHAGAGALALLAGLLTLRRYRALPLAVALGGLLLLLFGGVGAGGGQTDPTNIFFAAYSALLGSTVGAASQTMDIVHFVVLAGAALALLAFGFSEYERPAPARASADPDGT